MSQGSQVVRRSLVTALFASVAVIVACSGNDGTLAPRAGGAVVEQAPSGPVVEVVGSELRLASSDGAPRTLARLDPEVDGELMHATVRPGDRGSVTVLALTRTPDAEGPRYELRYLVADEQGTTDLYWFPWRLQVVDDLADVFDAPPLPVWSPDGASVAWVEWDGEGTRLRTVAWRDDGASSNPSDDASAYELDGVPPGTQLDAWEVGSDGVPVLRGDDGDTVWRIRLDVGRRAIAMPDTD
jgi:hypothetical protein